MTYFKNTPNYSVFPLKTVKIYICRQVLKQPGKKPVLSSREGSGVF